MAPEKVSVGPNREDGVRLVDRAEARHNANQELHPNDLSKPPKRRMAVPKGVASVVQYASSRRKIQSEARHAPRCAK